MGWKSARQCCVDKPTRSHLDPVRASRSCSEPPRDGVRTTHRSGSRWTRGQCRDGNGTVQQTWQRWITKRPTSCFGRFFARQWPTLFPIGNTQSKLPWLRALDHQSCCQSCLGPDSKDGYFSNQWLPKRKMKKWLSCKLCFFKKSEKTDTWDRCSALQKMLHRQDQKDF